MRTAVWAVSLVAMAVAAGADTIYLKTGVTVDGVIQKREDGKLIVKTGSRTVAFREQEVVKIEENDKTGAFDKKAAMERAKRREAELEAETGLPTKQRKEVQRILRKFLLDPPEEHERAKRYFVRLYKSVDFFPYFDLCIDSMFPPVVKGMLDVMYEVDAVRAVPTVRKVATFSDPGVREAAIHILGRVQDVQSRELVARALIDDDLGVRLAGTYAAETLKLIEATPLLLANLHQHNPSLQNASKKALSAIWSTEQQAVAFDDRNEWQAFWQANADRVPNALEPSMLLPLVPPGTMYEYE